MEVRTLGADPVTSTGLLAAARGNRNSVVGFAALILATFLVGGWLLLLVPLFAWRLAQDMTGRGSSRRAHAPARVHASHGRMRG